MRSILQRVNWKALLFERLPRNNRFFADFPKIRSISRNTFNPQVVVNRFLGSIVIKVSEVVVIQKMSTYTLDCNTSLIINDYYYDVSGEVKLRVKLNLNCNFESQIYNDFLSIHLYAIT